MTHLSDKAAYDGDAASAVAPQEARLRLRTVPTTLREANAFVAAHHRHHKPVRGHTSSTAVIDAAGVVRGVAIIGRPLARQIDHRQVCEVLRVATDGCANACSALYGACCRIAKAFGYAHIITYTLSTEPGTSLRAAGWKPVAVTDGGSWSREGRERDDDHPLIPKVRWECRCSSASSYRRGGRSMTQPRPVTSSPAGHVHYEDDPDTCTEFCLVGVTEERQP